MTRRFPFERTAMFSNHVPLSNWYTGRTEAWELAGRAAAATRGARKIEMARKLMTVLR